MNSLLDKIYITQIFMPIEGATGVNRVKVKVVLMAMMIPICA